MRSEWATAQARTILPFSLLPFPPHSVFLPHPRHQQPSCCPGRHLQQGQARTTKVSQNGVKHLKWCFLKCHLRQNENQLKLHRNLQKQPYSNCCKLQKKHCICELNILPSSCSLDPFSSLTILDKWHQCQNCNIHKALKLQLSLFLFFMLYII